jgi:HEPN domain-containing protein
MRRNPEGEGRRWLKQAQDAYYLPTRYPNSLPGGVPAEYYDDEAEALEAERMAGAVLAFVKEKLSPGGGA